MPSEPATQFRSRTRPRPVHVNVQGAARAPRWRAAKYATFTHSKRRPFQVRVKAPPRKLDSMRKPENSTGPCWANVTLLQYFAALNGRAVREAVVCRSDRAVGRAQRLCQQPDPAEQDRE